VLAHSAPYRTVEQKATYVIGAETAQTRWVAAKVRRQHSGSPLHSKYG
jgi:hypothetical protein